MTSYAVVIERAADGGYGAWCPDLPGCVALADTEETWSRCARPSSCTLLGPVARSHRAQPLPIWSAGGSRDPGEVVAAERMTLVPAARDQRLRNRAAAALT